MTRIAKEGAPGKVAGVHPCRQNTLLYLGTEVLTWIIYEVTQ